MREGAEGEVAATVVFTSARPQIHVEALLLYLDAAVLALAITLALTLFALARLYARRYCGFRPFACLQASRQFGHEIPIFFRQVRRNGKARATIFVEAAETIVHD